MNELESYCEKQKLSDKTLCNYNTETLLFLQHYQYLGSNPFKSPSVTCHYLDHIPPEIE